MAASSTGVVPVNATRPPMIPWPQTLPSPAAREQNRTALTRKGNLHLKATLVTAAISAAQTKGTYLRDKFHRLKARMTAKRAAVAIAHKILVAVWGHAIERTQIHAKGRTDLSQLNTLALVNRNPLILHGSELAQTEYSSAGTRRAASARSGKFLFYINSL
jgi:hypothetical protein